MTPAIRCEDAVQRLWRYLDGALEGADHDQVEHHLSFCLRCCGELEFARELQDLLNTRTGARIPGDARNRLEALITDLGDDLDDRQHDDRDGDHDDRRDDTRHPGGAT